ncbi:MAG: universal stress protein [Bacteroidetes bacterium]|nr:universal stress protein [Bacteroidota bacterium]
MEKHRNILVPYDFTPEAECALKHAVCIAEMGKGTVHMVHILDKKSQSKLKSNHKSEEDLRKDLARIAAEHCTENAQVLDLVKEGDIFHDISNAASELGADLIIFGTHGVRGMQHILGAFALKLVTSATLPVIIVQRRPIRANGYKKIVYPVDENPYSKQKAYAVADFAAEHNAEILLFPKKNHDEHFQNYTNGNLRYSEKVFEENGIPFTISENNKSGSFDRQVIEFAAAHDADLISIITQDSDDMDLGDIFVGSEDVHIINNDAEIPTLCINAVVSMKVGGLSGVTGT